MAACFSPSSKETSKLAERSSPVLNGDVRTATAPSSAECSWQRTRKETSPACSCQCTPLWVYENGTCYRDRLEGGDQPLCPLWLRTCKSGVWIMLRSSF